MRGARFFELAGNREKATEAAIHVQKVLPVQGILPRLSTAHEEDGVSLTLGGPGIGKTKEKVTECTNYVLEKTNRRAMIVAPLKSVRNLLTSNLVEAGFRQHMRVIGTSALSLGTQKRKWPIVQSGPEFRLPKPKQVDFGRKYPARGCTVGQS